MTTSMLLPHLWPQSYTARRAETDGDAFIAGAVRTLRDRSCTVAVVGAKGGVGATTIALLAGVLLAPVPDARPVLVELTADWGTTERLLGLGEGPTIADLLAHLTAAHHAGRGFVQGFTAPWERLPLLLAPRDPALVARLTSADYRRALCLLAAHYQPLLLDCGPSLTHPLTRFALAVADHVVLVTGPDPISLHRAGLAVRFLTDTSTAISPGAAVSGDPACARSRALTDLTLVLNGADVTAARAIDIPQWKEVMPHLNALVPMPPSEPLRRRFAAGTLSVETVPGDVRRATKAVLAAVLGRLAYP